MLARAPAGLGALAHIRTGSPLWADKLQKLAPGLQTTTSGGTCGCGGPAYSHKWEKAPTFCSSDSSERERQICGPTPTFPIGLWKLRLWHTLYVLSLTPHLIKHWFYNHHWNLGGGSRLSQQSSSTLRQHTAPSPDPSRPQNWPHFQLSLSERLVKFISPRTF